MKLSSLLDADRIVTKLGARTLDAAIPEILEQVSRFRPLVPVAEIVQAVLRREAQSSTAMEHGIAIPHARVPGLRDFYAMLGAPEQPLQDKGLDGRPVDLVFLIVASDEKNTVMLQTMAAIGALSKDAARLDAMRSADSAEAVWQCIEDSGVQVKKGLYARDIMVAPPVVAHEGMSLGELLDAMFEHGVHQAPVCSPSGDIIGAVTSREIIGASLPPYLTQIQDLGFLGEFEPFESFFKREKTLRVAEFVNREPLIVESDDLIIQVVFRMRQRQQRFAYVREQGKLVGVVDRDDIVLRILRF